MSDADSSGTEQYETEETPEEAHLNRGVITIFEQTKDTENAKVGDRSVRLGYHPDKVHILDDVIASKYLVDFFKRNTGHG